MFGVPASECVCTSPNWRDCDDNCDACWGEECHAALRANSYGRHYRPPFIDYTPALTVALDVAIRECRIFLNPFEPYEGRHRA